MFSTQMGLRMLIQPMTVLPSGKHVWDFEIADMARGPTRPQRQKLSEKETWTDCCQCPKMPARDTRNEPPNLRHNMFPFAPCWENIFFCFCLLICSPIGPAAPDHFGRVRQLERYCCFATRPAVWRYYRVIKKGESSNVSGIWLPFNVLQIPSRDSASIRCVLPWKGPQLSSFAMGMCLTAAALARISAFGEHLGPWDDLGMVGDGGLEKLRFV